MRPDTVHFIAVVLRHCRGILNAIEKFEHNTDPSVRAEEIQNAVVFGQKMLGSVGHFARVTPPKDQVHEMGLVVEAGRLAISSSEKSLSKG